MNSYAAFLALALCACAAVVALEPRARYDGVALPGAGARPVLRTPAEPNPYRQGGFPVSVKMPSTALTGCTSTGCPGTLNRGMSREDQIAQFSPLPLLPK